MILRQQLRKFRKLWIDTIDNNPLKYFQPLMPPDGDTTDLSEDHQLATSGLDELEPRDFPSDNLYDDRIKLSNFAKQHKGPELFDYIGGMDGLKKFCLQSLTDGAKGARGVLLLGLQGTGKSSFAKALGNEVKRKTICLDLSLMTSYLAKNNQWSLQKIFSALDRQEPSIIFIDEIENTLASLQSSNQSDGGTKERIFAAFLHWLNLHKSDSYVVATCNSMEKLPAEFLRQDRWDSIFFIDQPSYEEREKIWELYKLKYDIEDQHPEGVTGWTGAEIKSACHLAQLQRINLTDAVKLTIPLAASSGKKVDQIRKLASGQFLCANSGEVYSLDSESTGKIISHLAQKFPNPDSSS